MEKPQQAMTGLVRVAAVAAAAVGLAALAGCASQVDLSSIRREQRMLARRLADQRADLDRLGSQISRLRGLVADDARYAGGAAGPGGPPAAGPRDPYAPGGYGADNPTGRPAGGRDYGTGTDYGTPTPPPAWAPSAPGGSTLRADMARGNDSEYQQGLQSYARADYQRAVQSLRNFVTRKPRDPIVPVAQYWIGEAYFSQGKYNESILAFNEILVSWPDSDRKPAALLKQAEAFARTGDKIDARMILQKLIEDHPGSAEAAAAKEQLRVLGG